MAVLSFEPVTLSWAGQSWTVPPERQLPLIAAVEDTLIGPNGEPAVQMLTRRGGPGYARLAAAFGAALRHAGADVTDDAVYLEFQRAFADRDQTVIMVSQAAIMGLMAIISPPLALVLAGKKKPEATGNQDGDNPESS